MAVIDTIMKVAFVVGSGGARPDVYRNVMSSLLNYRMQNLRQKMFEKTLAEEKRQFDEQMAFTKERFEWEKQQLMKIQQSMAELFMALGRSPMDIKSSVKETIKKAFDLNLKLSGQQPAQEDGNTQVPSVSFRPFNIMKPDQEALRITDLINNYEPEPSYPIDVRSGRGINIKPFKSPYRWEDYVRIYRDTKRLMDEENVFYPAGGFRSAIERYLNVNGGF